MGKILFQFQGQMLGVPNWEKYFHSHSTNFEWNFGSQLVGLSVDCLVGRLVGRLIGCQFVWSLVITQFDSISFGSDDQIGWRSTERGLRLGCLTRKLSTDVQKIVLALRVIRASIREIIEIEEGTLAREMLRLLKRDARGGLKATREVKRVVLELVRL